MPGLTARFRSGFPMPRRSIYCVTVTGEGNIEAR
jgi:hypothetical protein